MRKRISTWLVLFVLTTSPTYGVDLPDLGPGWKIQRIQLQGFQGYNIGEHNHPKNQGVGYSPFQPAQLDADPELEWIVKEWRANHWPSKQHWCPNTHHANLQAFDHDGSPMWTFDQGTGVEIGYGYGPALIWDVDGDGIDEIFCRYAVDKKRQWPKVVTIQSGSEWLVRIDGATGKEVARCAYVKPTKHHDVAARSAIMPMYLQPGVVSLAMVRSYFTNDSEVMIVTPDLKEVIWTYSGSPGQGTHCYSTADVDNDGKDEVILGCAVVDDNGTELWNLKLGHNDTTEVADIMPDRPGLEMFVSGSDEKQVVGVVDPATGKYLWQHRGETGDSQGAIADFLPSWPGLEIMTSLFTGKTQKGRSTYKKSGFYAADGTRIDLSEVGIQFDPRLISTVNSRIAMLNANGSVAMNGVSFQLPVGATGYTWYACDIRGDWREEILGIRNGEIVIVECADASSSDHPTLRSNLHYRKMASRVARGFNMSHSMHPMPDHTWPLPDKNASSISDRPLKRTTDSK